MAGIGRWIGDTISSLVARTVQLSLVIVNGSINNLSDKINIGGIANQRNEVKDGQESSSSQTSRPEDLDTFDCTELKTYYSTTLCKASPLPWYPKQTRYIDEVYTELALEKSKTSKFGVEGLFEQWHKHNSKGGSSRLLIEGDAGYGKSTLMLKIASDWCKIVPNDYIRRFSLLFVVKLGRVGEDRNLLGYMDSIYEEKMRKKVKDVLESKGAEVLVLLDGYDEANAKTKEEVDRIMQKETMSKCHVVLTSRCGHVPDDVKGHALLVRVTGFGERQVAVAVGKFFIKARHLTKADVTSYLVKTVRLSIDDFKSVEEKDPLRLVDQRLSLEQCKQFWRKLRDESPYKELAQCPLLCVMMCCLVSDCQNGKLPSTVSGLYFAMINRNLYRAERKRPRPAGEVEEQWKWDELDNRIVEGHENYLQDFGHLCIEGLKTRNMSFTLFDITGEKRPKATNLKVNRLIETGVLVQDTNVSNPCYQVPHRTTAEFLAAYCLSRETDQNLCQQNLLDLFRLKASFDEVAASLIEMGKTKCLTDAFCDIKFPDHCLTRFMKSYFFEHGAAGTWKEFKDALPNKLEIEKVTVSSAEPNETLLQMYEVLDKDNIRKTIAGPSDCLVSVHMEGDFSPELLQTLSKSGARLERLDCHLAYFNDEGHTSSSEVARIRQELLKSHSCPVHLKFLSNSEDLLLAVTEAMQEVPEGCSLKRLDFITIGRERDTSPLEDVLAEKWLSHLQHLSLRFCKPKPILKRIREPGCSLTSLHLSFCELHIEDLMMLASKLETLSLFGMELDFNVTETSKDAVKERCSLSLRLKFVKLFLRELLLSCINVLQVTEISKDAVKERCSLKSLRLKGVKLFFKGSLPSVDVNQELLLAWRNVALHLEELTIDECEFPFELFSWLNLSLPNLRTVAIGGIESIKPNGDRQFYANQVLEALTRSSGDSIEELSLLEGFWERYDVLNLHPIREALQRCPRMKSVKLGYNNYDDISAASIGPGPSTPLSPSDEEALKSDNIHNALLKIVLSVPKLQTLTSWYFLNEWEEIGTFHAIADKAEKWPGKTNDNDCNSSLTLHDLFKEYAFNAMHVFRERGLEYHLRYITEGGYELWFPPSGL